jgi:hypothetical protein
MTLFKDDTDLLADLRTFMPSIFNAATETAKGGKFKRKNMDALLKKRRRSLINKQIQDTTSLSEKQMQFFEKVNICTFCGALKNQSVDLKINPNSKNTLLYLNSHL